MELFRRLQSFRQIFRFNIVRSIAASPTDDIGDELRNNPFFEKYSEKLRSFQKENPEEFKSRLEESKASKSKGKSRLENQDQFSPLLNPKGDLRVKNPLETNLKRLNKIMKVDLLQEKSCAEIKQIWERYHRQKDGVFATIPCDRYDMMHGNGKKYPLFVFPLPRGKGYEFFLCQVADHTVNFTPLINYQAHKENAPVCLTLVHYVELKEKGIVLMCGEFNKDVLLLPTVRSFIFQPVLVQYSEHSDLKDMPVTLVAPGLLATLCDQLSPSPAVPRAKQCTSQLPTER